MELQVSTVDELYIIQGTLFFFNGWADLDTTGISRKWERTWSSTRGKLLDREEMENETTSMRFDGIKHKVYVLKGVRSYG